MEGPISIDGYNMTKFERVKFWVKKNQDAIIAISLGTAVIGLVILGVKSEMKYREQLASQMDTYIDELNATLDELKDLELVQ